MKFFFEVPTFPDIVLLSTGAHYHNEIELFNSSIQSVMDKLTNLKKYTYNSNISFPKVFWMQVSVGHVGCNRITKPLTSISDLNLETEFDIYHWKYLDLYNQIAKELFLKNNMSYFDMTPLKYRADAHISSGEGNWTLDSFKNGRDCLHYCAPGPLDFFSRAFLSHLFHIKAPNSERNESKYSKYDTNFVQFPLGTDTSLWNKSQKLHHMHDVVVHCFSGETNFYYVEHGLLRRIPNLDTMNYNNFSLKEVEYFDWDIIKEATRGPDFPACVPGPRCR
jgi:hypothetical protein